MTTTVVTLRDIRPETGEKSGLAFLPIRKLSIFARHAKPFSGGMGFHYLIEAQVQSDIAT